MILSNCFLVLPYLKYLRHALEIPNPTLMKVSRYSNDMAHFEIRGKGHFEVRGKLPSCAIHGWSAVEDCPRPEAGSAPNVRQYNSGACICWSVTYYRIVRMQHAPRCYLSQHAPRCYLLHNRTDLWLALESKATILRIYDLGLYSWRHSMVCELESNKTGFVWGAYD